MRFKGGDEKLRNMVFGIYKVGNE